MKFARPSSPSHPLRIFIVENHADTLNLLTQYLQGMGHTVCSANTMAEALEALPNSPCDALISDIGLPDGDGWLLMEQAHLPRHRLRDCHERFRHERRPAQEQGRRVSPPPAQTLRAVGTRNAALEEASQEAAARQEGSVLDLNRICPPLLLPPPDSDWGIDSAPRCVRRGMQLQAVTGSEQRPPLEQTELAVAVQAEQRRIAQALHDTVSQTLTAAYL